MEAFKEIDDENMILITELLNKWWNEEDIPEEVLEARIVLISKKGDTSNLSNYRPIALLNSIYKIVASIIQKRLANTLDDKLQKTQCGFRKKKSTSQAIHIIRRIIDMGEKSDRTLFNFTRLGKSI